MINYSLETPATKQSNIKLKVGNIVNRNSTYDYVTLLVNHYDIQTTTERTHGLIILVA